MLLRKDAVTALRTATTEIQLGSLRVPVDSWEQPSLNGLASQDAICLTTFQPAFWNNHRWVLRAVVVDGVTPVEVANTQLEIDNTAIFAARIAVQSFEKPEPLRDCADSANRFLDNVVRIKAPQLTRRQRPQAVVRAVDIYVGANGFIDNINVLNAGDSTSHFLIDGEWVDPILDNGFAAKSHRQWRAWLATHPSASLEQTQVMEDVFFGTPDDHDSAPLGAFEQLKTTFAVIPGTAIGTIHRLGLVLTTDGIRASESLSVSRYLDHLMSGDHRSNSVGHIKSTDDVALLSIGSQSPKLATTSVIETPLSA